MSGQAEKPGPLFNYLKIYGVLLRAALRKIAARIRTPNLLNTVK